MAFKIAENPAEMSVYSAVLQVIFRPRFISSKKFRSWLMHQSIPPATRNFANARPRDWQGGQMPRSSPGGGWAQVELTDA